jgi:hypothetical protein
MKKSILKLIAFSLFLMSVITSCEKKLDLLPTNDLVPDDVFVTKQGFRQVFAKMYGGFALTGNNGPAGSEIFKVLMKGSLIFLVVYGKHRN